MDPPPATGTVRVAGTTRGCQSVAGLPSTAASGSAPEAALLARAAWQRTTSDVGARSGRRVRNVSGVPGLSVSVVPRTLIGMAFPLSRVTVVVVAPMVTVKE